jgi:hypothetical protein
VSKANPSLIIIIDETSPIRMILGPEEKTLEFGCSS